MEQFINLKLVGDKIEIKTLTAPSGDTVSFFSEHAGFSIQFTIESPFVSDAGALGRPPITSSDGSPTPPETLKVPTTRRRFPYTATMVGKTKNAEIIIS